MVEIGQTFPVAPRLHDENRYREARDSARDTRRVPASGPRGPTMGALNRSNAPIVAFTHPIDTAEGQVGDETGPRPQQAWSLHDEGCVLHPANHPGR